MKKIILLLLGIAIGFGICYFYFNNETTTESMTKPKGVITPAEAKVLDQAFSLRHQLISDSIVKQPDNRSSWYSLTDLRDYLNYAENQAKELGYTMDGVRVYLGAHPTVKGQVGYTTMFFIPTGYESVAEGNMLGFSTRGGGKDIPGGGGMNAGGDGDPPGANYPQ